MSLRSLIYPPVANIIYHQYTKASLNIIREQSLQFRDLLNSCKETAFGKVWGFGKIRNYNDYRSTLPLQHYEDLSEYIRRASKGEPDVLWPGIPKYFVRTSGTSSGKKFIPITSDALKSQTKGRITAMANYSIKYNRLNQMKGPMLFFSSISSKEPFGNYSTTQISSLIAEQIPQWLRKYNLPGSKAMQIEEFPKRMEQIITEVFEQRNELRGIVAFPPWLNFFLDQLYERTSLDFQDLFPKFSLLVTSGMSLAPYKSKARLKMGNSFDHIETYPTSEGFIGFTDSLDFPGFSLMPSNGLFFEFVKLPDVNNRYAQRYCLEEVEVNVDYALVISSNTGLMSYVIGDTVRFISYTPLKMIITGRINQTISIMSENVSISDIDSCIAQVSEQSGLPISEYICFGSDSEPGVKPHYKWIIECSVQPDNCSDFATLLHETLKNTNTLYGSFSTDGLIDKPEVLFVDQGSFFNYLKSNEAIDFQRKMNHICIDKEKYLDCKNFMISNKFVLR